MSALTPEEIAALLKVPDTPPRAKRGTSTGTRRKKTDPLVNRDIQTWFNAAKVLREWTHTCENPDCSDPRPADDRGRKCTVEIDSKHMCRYCFLEGWLKNE